MPKRILYYFSLGIPIGLLGLTAVDFDVGFPRWFTLVMVLLAIALGCGLVINRDILLADRKRGRALYIAGIVLLWACVLAFLGGFVRMATLFMFGGQDCMSWGHELQNCGYDAGFALLLAAVFIAPVVLTISAGLLLTSTYGRQDANTKQKA